jgi:hypothetical protein
MTGRAELLDRLADFPERVAEAARSASARPTPDGEWSPDQVVRHLIAVDLRVHQRRLDDLTVEDAPSWTWQEPGPWPDEPDLGLEGVLARFAATRGTTVSSFRRLDEVGWALTGRHATFGELTAEGLLRLAIDHDEEHLTGLR